MITTRNLNGFSRLFCYILIAVSLSYELVGCNPTNVVSTQNGPKVTLTVFAGVSLTEPFQEIVKEFESSNNDIDVQISFATGQQQLEQMNNGAHVDVFAAATEQQMQDAIGSGNVISGTQQTFAHNKLVVVMPNDNPGRIQKLNDLATPGEKIILGAKETAIGQYTLVFLDKTQQDTDFLAGYKEATLKNVVSYEASVKVVLTKISLGEGDAGVVFLSDAVSAGSDKVQQLSIPDSDNVIANYLIAVTKGSKNTEAAQKFVDYVLSPQAQQILERYGFLGK